MKHISTKMTNHKKIKSMANTEGAICTHCNFNDNYYGDQICIAINTQGKAER